MRLGKGGNSKKFFLDTKSLRYYRFCDQKDQGAFGGKSSLESSPAENRDRLSLDEKKERVSSASNEPVKKKRISFETESLAEVYAKQGHILMALEIYKKIQKRNPSDEIGKRISELEGHPSTKRGIKSKEQDE